MLSAKRALSIAFECNKEKRDAMIDSLSEADTKYMLKLVLTAALSKGLSNDNKE